VFEAGDVTEPLAVRKAGEGDRKQGTSVRVWPDPKYFESAALPMADLTHLLRSKAVLMPGVTVTLVNEKTKGHADLALQGRPARLFDADAAADPVIPLFEGEGFAEAVNEKDNFAEGEGAPGAWPSPKTASRCARATST
jgi:topoisomerase-4 subunit B